MKPEVKEWMNRAEHDLETATYNLKGDRIDAAAFFCQQAVEKALKAIYIKKFGKLIKTHDLSMLGEKVNLPDNLLELCDELIPFYIETRYPGVYENTCEIDEVEEMINKSEELIKWVKERI